jgi:hypothetical protein
MIADVEHGLGFVKKAIWDRFYDFFYVFSPKNWRKDWRFLLKTKLNYAKICITLVSEKNANFFTENWHK